MQTLESLIFFLVKTAVKFRNLQISKVLNTDANTIIPIPFKVKYISTLKYLVYRVFSIEARRLQDPCISIWALVFYYCISNNLPREKTVIQMQQYKLSFSKYAF